MDAYADALGIAEPAAPVKAPAGSGNPALIAGRDDLVQTLAGLHSTLADAKEGSALYQRTLIDIQNAQTQLQKMPGGAPAAPAAAAPKSDPYAAALGIGGPSPVAAAPAAAPAPVTPKEMAGQGFRAVAANQLTGLGAQIVGGYRGLSTLLSGGTLDDAANNVRDYAAAHTYTPDAASAGGKAVASFASPANPANMPGEALDWAGGKVTDVTGSPALGAAVNAGGTAALAALGLRGRVGTAPVEVGPARPGTGIYKPVAATQTPALPNTGDAVTLPQQLPKDKPAPVANPEPAQAVPQSAQAVQELAQSAPAKLFPQTPTTAPAGSFGTPEQLARAKVMESVGIDPDKLRRSAISGDGTGGATDFQTAKLDSPAGRQMKAIIEGEKAALTNHAEGLVSDTGGTHGVDQSALYARGNTILAPLDGLKQWFDSKTSALYKAADERADGVPTKLDSFSSILNDSSELTNSDRVHLQSSLNAYIKKLGMAGDDGSIAGSAKQAETVRKYLNEQWSPQNSRLVGKLKDALDEDVTASAGDDIYAEARRIRSMRGQTLDNPNGIAKLMDSSGPEGINRAVPVEKVADSLTGMPVDQFSHVIKTLTDSPPELQPQAQAALAEIKAQFANKVHAIGSAQQGQWNAKGVTKYLQNNAARMAQVFTPEEIAKFRTLNDAGHIVAKDQSYPGAAVQGHNLLTHGVMSSLPTAGAAAGGYIAGPAGAAVGAAAGRMASGAVENASTLRAVKKRTVKLSELLMGKDGKTPSMASREDVVGESQGGRSADDKTKGALRSFDPEKATTTLYRAHGDREQLDRLHAFSSWSEDRQMAEEYTDNQGFGGPDIRSVRADTSNTLDVGDINSVRGKKTLAEELGYEDPQETAQQWQDAGYRYPWEESSKVASKLKESGFDFIRYEDDYPADGVAIVPLHDFKAIPNESPAPDSGGARLSGLLHVGRGQ